MMTGVRSRPGLAALAVPIRPRGTASMTAIANTAANVRIFSAPIEAAKPHYVHSVAMYLRQSRRFSLRAHILQHRWTKTVPRLVLLDTNALLMPFQFHVHLEAELHRLLGDDEIAVPSLVLSELTLKADDNRDARPGPRLAKQYRATEGHGSADDSA